MNIILFKSIIHSYLNSDIEDLNNSKKFLINVKNNIIKGLTITETRCLFYSLEIYKFNKLLKYPMYVYSICRNIILNTLNNTINEEQIKDYLLKFLDWGKHNLNDYLNELCESYTNLTEIKTYYELNSNIEHNIIKEHIEILYETIKTNIYIIDKNYLNNYIINNKKKKKSFLEEKIKVIYLNKLREELETKNYDLLIKNIEEIKNKLIYISPLENFEYINKTIDLIYITQIINNNLNKQFIISLINNINNVLKFIVKNEKIEELNRNLNIIIEKNEINDSIVICLKTIFDILLPLHEIHLKYNNDKRLFLK